MKSMKRICPKCHFIGTGRHKGSLMAVGIIIGSTIVLFASNYQKSIEISSLILVLGLFVAIIGIRNFYTIGKECPLCKQKKIPSIDEPDGQQIIKENNLNVEDTVTNICTNCQHKGLPNRGHTFKGSILTIIVGIVYLLFSFIFGPIAILGGLLS